MAKDDIVILIADILPEKSKKNWGASKLQNMKDVLKTVAQNLPQNKGKELTDEDLTFLAKKIGEDRFYFEGSMNPISRDANVRWGTKHAYDVAKEFDKTIKRNTKGIDVKYIYVPTEKTATTETHANINTLYWEAVIDKYNPTMIINSTAAKSPKGSGGEYLAKVASKRGVPFFKAGGNRGFMRQKNIMQKGQAVMTAPEYKRDQKGKTYPSTYFPAGTKGVVELRDKESPHFAGTSSVTPHFGGLVFSAIANGNSKVRSGSKLKQLISVAMMKEMDNFVQSEKLNIYNPDEHDTESKILRRFSKYNESYFKFLKKMEEREETKNKPTNKQIDASITLGGAVAL